MKTCLFHISLLLFGCLATQAGAAEPDNPGDPVLARLSGELAQSCVQSVSKADFAPDDGPALQAACDCAVGKMQEAYQAVPAEERQLVAQNDAAARLRLVHAAARPVVACFAPVWKKLSKELGVRNCRPNPARARRSASATTPDGSDGCACLVDQVSERLINATPPEELAEEVWSIHSPGPDRANKAAQRMQTADMEARKACKLVPSTQ